MVLFIDTHLNDIVIILYDQHKIIKKIVNNQMESSKILMPTISEVIGDNKIESIIVVNGPGSFTGVRLGVTIAKTLAYTLNIPIRSISTLKCMAISTKGTIKNIAFNDKNGYYIGCFNENINDYFYLNNSDYIEYKKNKEIIENIEMDYEKIIEEVLNWEPINPHLVNPLYIKKLDVDK